MAKAVTTPELQAKAISLLASGNNQSDTSKKIGVSLRTLSRWVSKPEFRAEIEQEASRRKDRLESELRASADAAQTQVIANLQGDLQELYTKLQKAQKLRIDVGTSMISKAMRRFQDLPEEAIAIKDIASLVTAGDKLLEKGFEMWADSLAIAELQEALGLTSKINAPADSETFATLPDSELRKLLARGETDE
jgi:transposase